MEFKAVKLVETQVKGVAEREAELLSNHEAEQAAAAAGYGIGPRANG